MPRFAAKSAGFVKSGCGSQWLYGEWLPTSGRAVRDTVMFEEYINNPRDAAPTELLTDIYLPLK